MSKFFQGKKTYITAAVGVVLTGLYARGYVDQSTFDVLASMAGFLGLGFLRSGISK